MKKYRWLIPIFMVAVMAASWYMLISGHSAEESQYEEYLQEARKHAANGVTKYAVENYRSALAVKSTPELYQEVSDYFLAQEDHKRNLPWCEEFLEACPREPAAYAYVLKAYVQDGSYQDFYDVLNMADKRGVASEEIEKLRAEQAYVYKLDYNKYEDVGAYGNHFCAVNKKGLWGYVDRFGAFHVPARYAAAAPFTQSGFAPVVNQEGAAYFIDKTGAKVLVPQEDCVSMGPMVDGRISAVRPDGGVIYLDADTMKALPDVYEDATTFNQGIAAVRQDGGWRLVQLDGSMVGPGSYEDVKQDEKRIICRNERLFVKPAGKGYIMMDSTGQQAGAQEFEDAKVFCDSTWAAVKLGGNWCFVDKDGNRKSDRVYEDARSYSNGLAAVKVDGKWGFVDENEELKIEAEFDEAKDFNEKGSCFVRVGSQWQLLKLYRLNRS